VLTQRRESGSRNWRLDAASIPPAEASSVSGATHARFLERRKCGAHAKLSRARAWRPWDRRGRELNRESGYDEASPAALRSTSKIHLAVLNQVNARPQRKMASWTRVLWFRIRF
jgi:hypothetical protein